MKDRNIELILILKYGDLHEAFIQWATGGSQSAFTYDEDEYMTSYAIETFPSLHLVRTAEKT